MMLIFIRFFKSHVIGEKSRPGCTIMSENNGAENQLAMASSNGGESYFYRFSSNRDKPM